MRRYCAPMKKKSLLLFNPLFYGMGMVLICVQSLAAGRDADTLQINKLLQRAEAYVQKKQLDFSSFKNGLILANQAMELSRKGRLPEAQGRACLIQAKLYATQPARDSVPVFAQRAILLFRKAQAEVLEADAEMQLVSCVRYNRTLTARAEVLCDSASMIYTRLAPKSKGMIDALYYKALFAWVRQDVKAAKMYCNQALGIYDALHSPRKEVIYAMLGIIYGNASGDPKGFDYTFKALRLAETYRDSSLAFTAAASIGGFYQAMNQPAKWLEYIKKAKSYVSFEKDRDRALTAAGYLAEALIANHQFQSALQVVREAYIKGDRKDEEYQILDVYAMDSYVYLKQYAAAQRLYPKVMGITQNPAAPWLYQSQAHLSVIRYLMAEHRFAPARAHLKALQAQPLNAYYVNLKLMTEDFLFKVDSAQGKYVDAIRHYQRYKSLNDSVNNRTHDKEVSLLQIQYESQKKDLDIVQKNKNIGSLKRQAGLRETALRSQVLSRNLSIAAAGLLALLLMLGYNRYQVKHRANQELEAQQTHINSQNSALQTLLEERDWLLKEVHHRTKNNLQIVISLLNSQLANVNDATAQEVLLESKQRMYAISLIHQRLYQGDNLSDIDMSQYLRELVSYLGESLDTGNRIRFELDLSELILDIPQAVPLGLIVNEAVTNAIKYAFTNAGRGNMIKITSKRTDRDHWLVSIADNGKGLPPDYHPEASKSLGMSLMFGLSRQLRGRIAFVNDGGVKVELKFPIVRT
jgi:two-component sensor histidine kinase